MTPQELISTSGKVSWLASVSPQAPGLVMSGGTSQIFFCGQQISPLSVSHSLVSVQPATVVHAFEQTNSAGGGVRPSGVESETTSVKWRHDMKGYGTQAID